MRKPDFKDRSQQQLKKITRGKLFQKAFLNLCKVAYETDDNATLVKCRVGEIGNDTICQQ